MDYEGLCKDLTDQSKVIGSSGKGWGKFAGTNRKAATAITDLLARAEAAEARAEKAERERDASIKELDDVSSAIDDLSDFIDEKIFPTVQYDIYTSLRDNADAISMWKYEKDWRGTKEE